MLNDSETWPVDKLDCVMLCVLGGSELESAEEACSEETADVTSGYVSAEEVS